jgi:hypothetical protein
LKIEVQNTKFSEEDPGIFAVTSCDSLTGLKTARNRIRAFLIIKPQDFKEAQLFNNDPTI